MGLKWKPSKINLGIKGQFLQFVPETLEHPLHFSDDQIAPVIPKIGNKIEKTVLLDQFHTCLSTFNYSLPKVMG